MSAIPNQMRAVLMKQQGGPEVLHVSATVDIPVLKSDEIMIKVHTSALNRADTLQRRGNYPVPAGASLILGLECAGEVVDVNNTSSPFKPGDRVMCLLSGGGYAEYAAVPYGCCIAIPAHLSYVEAAAIPEVWLTAYQLTRTIGQLSANQTLLIHAGASGVGTAAIQLAKLFNAKSVVTAGTTEKLDFCKSLGASAAFNYKTKPFGNEVKEWMAANSVYGINVVIDPVGATHFQDNVDVLGVDGKYVLFGLMGGVDVQCNLGKLLAKRIQLIASTLRSRTTEYKCDLVASFVKEVMPSFDKKECKPIVYKTFNINEIVAAHELMESDDTMGKIILEIV